MLKSVPSCTVIKFCCLFTNICLVLLRYARFSTVTVNLILVFTVIELVLLKSCKGLSRLVHSVSNLKEVSSAIAIRSYNNELKGELRKYMFSELDRSLVACHA